MVIYVPKGKAVSSKRIFKHRGAPVNAHYFLICIYAATSFHGTDLCSPFLWAVICWRIYYTSSIILSSIMKFPPRSHSTYFVLHLLFRRPLEIRSIPSLPHEIIWVICSLLGLFYSPFFKKMRMFCLLVLSAHFTISLTIIYEFTHNVR